MKPPKRYQKKKDIRTRVADVKDRGDWSAYQLDKDKVGNDSILLLKILGSVLFFVIIPATGWLLRALKGRFQKATQSSGSAPTSGFGNESTKTGHSKEDVW
jgi:hypothetical protein